MTDKVNKLKQKNINNIKRKRKRKRKGEILNKKK